LASVWPLTWQDRPDEFMRLTYVVHIVAGSLGLLFGYVALYAAKGGTLHRKSGMLFVYAMLTVAAVGLTIAAVRGVAPALNIPVALLASYLVLTSLTTVRPVAAESAAARRFHVGGAVVALAISVTNFAFALDAVTGGSRTDGIPASPFVMFGVVSLLASAGDLRIVRSGALRGGARLARHLWRMCFALFIASLSFFIGQAKVIPKPIRIPGLLALPVLAVLVTMLYWLWRVRVRRSVRGVLVSAPDAI
jgi:uncharacterized membrane protein